MVLCVGRNCKSLTERECASVQQASLNYSKSGLIMAAQARQFLGVAIASGILVSSILLVPLSQTAMRESPEMAASYLP